MATIFTRIIDGEIPGTFVLRDEHCVAFMSINPIAGGHTLVVPRAEIDHWLDASAQLRAHLFEVAGHIADAQQAAFSPARVGLMIAGFEVPHTHLHVIPMTSMADISFENAAVSVDRDDLEAAAEAIRERLRAAGHDAVA